jgi:hypothetical protein
MTTKSLNLNSSRNKITSIILLCSLELVADSCSEERVDSILSQEKFDECDVRTVYRILFVVKPFEDEACLNVI